MSLEFWPASDWAMQSFSLALSDIGTSSNCHPGHRAINHPAGIRLHFLNSYQFLQGTKRPLWALGSKTVSSLWGFWFWFMSDVENDCGEREKVYTRTLFLLLSNFNKAVTKLLLIATECEHLLNSRSRSDRPLFVYIRASPCKLPHWRNCTKIKSSSSSHCKSPTWWSHYS